ncbi:hypothetical protein NDU88_001918 [Pleurodeles waltl]|uniref:Uncharacterized protein n=1 Tax=Pleurodeles waltl TaxID=8319 RepID=A0AAV7UW30_PLEWA|nr:hypothetical protein NDU88_001918 [Pleurodeles waltl]
MSGISAQVRATVKIPAVGESVLASVKMAERKVQEALRLLEEAGRLDHLQDCVGGPPRPPRRASGGVAAAVLTCSTARNVGRRQEVSRRGEGRVRGWGGGVIARGRGRALETHRAAPLGSPRTRGVAVRARASSGVAAGAGVMCGRGLRARGPARSLVARNPSAEWRVGAARGRVLAAARRGSTGKGRGIKAELGGVAPPRRALLRDVPAQGF